MRTPNSWPASEIHLRFGEFELKGASELLGPQGRVALQPQPLRLLAALAQRPGAIVSRDELRQILWGELHVDHEHGLNFAVRQVRIALADSPDAPRFVETIPKLGYRFLAPVCVVEPEPAAAMPEPAEGIRRSGLAAALVIALLGLTLARHAASPARVAPRVLVLPFEAADGFSDAVIAELSRLPPDALAVLAPTTAAVAGARDTRALSTSHVVEGRRDGDGLELRLTQLRDGRVLWSGREAIDTPFAGARIARAVAVALDVVFAGPIRARDPEPALAEGFRLLRQGGAADIARAQVLFAAAAAAAPHSPGAQLGLGESWRRSWRPLRETAERWRAAAERAVQLDAADPRGHLLLAAYRLYAVRDLAASRVAFERALALAPGMAAVHDAYAAWYSAQGRHEEALALAQRAAELDPLATGVQLDLGWYLYLARRPDAAVAALLRAFALERNPSCLDYAARAHIVAGRWDAARGLALRVMQERSAEPDALAFVAALPDPQRAVAAYLRWNLARQRTRGVPPPLLALEQALLGEDAIAVAGLDQGFADGGSWVLCFLGVDPAWDSLRPRPDFQALVARAGIASRDR